MTYTQSQWNLDDLLPSADGATVEKAIAVFDRRVKKVERWRPKLKASLSAKAFGALLDDYEAMRREGVRLAVFAELWFSADTQNQAALALLSRVDELNAQVQNRVLFFSLWWKALDNQNARRLMKAAGDRRYWLETIRHFRPQPRRDATRRC